MKKTLLLATALAGAVVLSGCGGGGGGGGGLSTPVVVPPAPPPPPPPPPPVAQPPSAFETSEYNNAFALDLLNASYAYSQGGTGQGQVVAVVDTGVVTTLPELQGQIHPASRDIRTGRGALTDVDGHGTFIAGLIAATKDDTGIHGLAFDAQVMAIRADFGPDEATDPTDCDTGELSCGFYGSDVASAVDYAVANGAGVINLSLGSRSPDQLILGALRRAVSAGVLVVIASGNSEYDEDTDTYTHFDTPDWPGQFATDTFALDRVVVVGSVDSSGAVSWFSNGPGEQFTKFLLAPGESVTSTSEAGGYAIGSGTSYAAPYVAASLALLLDAFPTLSSEDALEILFETATDLGAAGPDNEYGWGIVDLERAFQPVGATSASFGSVTVAVLEDAGGEGQQVDLSRVLAAPAGAFGDFVTTSGVLADMMVRDAYDRGFVVSPQGASRVAGSALSGFESAALAQRLDTRAALTPFGSAAFRPGDDSYIALDNLVDDDALRPEMSVAFRLGPVDASLGRGFASPAPGARAGGAVLTATSFSGGVAQLTSQGEWAAFSYGFGPWTFGVRSAGSDESGFSAANFSRAFGRQSLTFESGFAQEARTTFGSSVLSRFGGRDEAESAFMAFAWSGPLAGGWRGAARIERADAALNAPTWMTIEEAPVASAWSFGAERDLDLATIGLTLSQPLRVEAGAISLGVPVAIDARTNGTLYETRTASLSPSGREMDLEGTIRLRLGDGAVTTIAARLAAEPGHVAEADPEAALWWGLRLTR